MKVVILICTCRGAGPSMEKIDFWELADRIPFELQYDYMLLHPKLCEEDGEALMGDLIKPDTVYITLACDVKKQAKLLANGFARAKVPMDSEHWFPISMALKNTEQVFEEVEAVIGKLEGTEYERNLHGHHSRKNTMATND